MATAGIRPVVEQTVDDRVHKGDMFTAHDITLEVRNKGQRVGHHEIRDAVHDYYTRGGMGVAYTRTSITVPAGGTPFLYHRTVDDPTSYGNIRGQGMVPNPSVSTIAVPPPSSISSTDDEDDEDDDDDQAIAIPPGLVSLPGGAAAINTGAPASVAGVAVGMSKPARAKPATSANRTQNKNRLVGRTVDGRDTLSIPSPLVRSANFKAGDKVYASAVQDGVEVTCYPTSANVCKRYTVDKHDHIRLTQAFLKRAGIGGKLYDVSGDSLKVSVKLHK